MVTGGGTGGHINPALAIADTVAAADPSAEIVFVGTPKGMENRLVPAAGYRLQHINIRGLKRGPYPSNLYVVWLMMTSQQTAKKLINDFRPDVIFGTGGYVCWPLLRQGARMGIPTALHEANALPGVACRALEPYLDKLFINFEQTRRGLKNPDAAIRVGMPVRPVFGTLSHGAAREELGLEGHFRSMVLSCGGSLGADMVNEAVLDLMKNYVSKNPDVYHLHGTGARNFDAFSEKFREAGLDRFPNIKIVPYIENMPTAMAAADLVINRAGAMTLAELAALSKPCILIPSPNVTDNHQYKNAMAVAEAGGAVVLEEKELGGGRLASETAALISDRRRLKEMSDGISTLALTDCAGEIYSSLLSIAKPMEK